MKEKEPYWITQVKLEGVVLRLYEHIVINKDKNRNPKKRSFWPNDSLIVANMKLLKELWEQINKQ